jgi:hypothetical protein
MDTSHSMQPTNEMPHESKQHEAAKDHGDPYQKLLWMIIVSFIAMYILMYAMVDKFANVIPNFNQFYMAGLMSSPMLIIELLLMGKMYPNKKLNRLLISLGVFLLVVFFLLIRGQAAIDDKQFLKSMIPHHAGAILMVEQSELKDPEVMQLAEDILIAQQQEIDFMKAKIEELENR